MTTALTQFERLESGGLWRAATDADARDVTVSFGKATLVLTDRAGLPLTHWSLAAVTRLNDGATPAVFTPSQESDETLEIEDDLMVDAIEKVRKALLKTAPKPRRLRALVPLGLAACVIAVAAIWGPGAFTRQTLSVVPDSKRTEIGATILGHYQRLTGPTCRNALGTAPLATLKNRLMGRDAKGQIVVVQALPQGATVLPGGIVLVDRALIERLDDPAIVSGFVLAAIAGRDSHDPLSDVLDDAGLGAAFTLFTTGDVSSDVLRAYAQSLKTLAMTPIDPDNLMTAFDAADVPFGPYAQLRGLDGVARDQNAPAAPILNDSDWVRLQGICAT